MAAFLSEESRISLLLSTAAVAWLNHADVKPPQIGFVCELKLLRGRISQWVEQGVFLRARSTISP